MYEEEGWEKQKFYLKITESRRKRGGEEEEKEIARPIENIYITLLQRRRIKENKEKFISKNYLYTRRLFCFNF